jgi:hypothetical protein
MKKHTLMAALLLVAIFALIGCTAVTNTSSDNDADAATPTAASSSNDDADAAARTNLELQVMRARQHLAATLNIDLSGVTVVETTPIEWNDSSLGCPEPGMMYLMVITPGYHIILAANGEQYEYHADENETVLLCPEDRSVLKGEEEPFVEIPEGAASLVEQARRDLAAKLGISFNNALVIQVTAVEWNDSSLGCPKPDMAYLTVITPGYHIVLEANGIQYNYHTDEGDSIVFCPDDRSDSKDSDSEDSALASADDDADKMSAKAREMAERAQQDLAIELGIPLDQVTVSWAMAVDWNDSSLGCPQPNTMYMDVITPGYLIALEANGLKYNYHTDENDYLILCSMADGSFAPSMEALIVEVKRDLANKLGISADGILFVKVTAVEWPDSSLGCPEPDKMYLMVVTPGYQIVLDVSGVKYNYHTNTDGYFVLCPNDRSGAGNAIEQQQRHQIDLTGFRQITEWLNGS